MQLHVQERQQPERESHGRAHWCTENWKGRHTCLQQARYATDGLHDSHLRQHERFGPERARFVFAHERDADYAEPGKGGIRVWPSL